MVHISVIVRRHSLLSAALVGTAAAELWLGTPPMGWDSFDSHPGGAYNESYARATALTQAATLLPSGYDVVMHEGFSAGGLLGPAGFPCFLRAT